MSASRVPTPPRPWTQRKEEILCALMLRNQMTMELKDAKIYPHIPETAFPWFIFQMLSEKGQRPDSYRRADACQIHFLMNIDRLSGIQANAVETAKYIPPGMLEDFEKFYDAKGKEDVQKVIESHLQDLTDSGYTLVSEKKARMIERSQQTTKHDPYDPNDPTDPNVLYRSPFIQQNESYERHRVLNEGEPQQNPGNL
ncbi:hypothetical protein HYFRA_00005211 [Hymenoscyphus fraxineus]|uniref:Uncharacterized protein n=1 Tax=Hymenoscyphus fraxineus TaxID=746836 RepID=A0A9N9LCT6_9HELO|nr:hypothetical protein HYFRA_00005211 [Hymenoscyphus fraxineus]